MSGNSSSITLIDNFKNDLSDFFFKITWTLDVEQKVRKRLARFLAYSFNLIELLEPDENKISDIIVILLKPQGKHGQGEVFLRNFLQVLLEILKNKTSLKEEDFFADCFLEKVEVKRESPNRFDIFINLACPKLEAITIENKLYAEDQPDQIKKYFEWLKRTYNDKFMLIYLTLDGRQSKTADEDIRSSNNYLEVSYREILIPWLEMCFKDCKAEKVRFFIQDFIDWIKQKTS